MEFRLDEGIAVLERTPGTLDAFLRGLPSPWIRSTEGGDTWSPYDVVGHLIQGETNDWIPRARLILEQGEATPFDPFDRFAQFELSKGKDLDGLLDTFARLRTANLATLRGWALTERQLQLTGRHPEFGVVTLRQLLATWVAHDLGHVVQVARTMARQYKEAIGPWTAYLSVMTPDQR
jgi:hypothetical protein